ncbi:hypothetical protein [Paenibacillus eucommiae]|uniref:Uncharacterized protein n=1 Tax=Paenibacillus eucommiae TaxID=1355755 RepID=A0ABS4IZH3_9BACL|nr:hypothetical protein [Paenibacillus eucommiae]MBP1991934.1 hypothetical protein [Paenibacillus eucommiae]
MVRFEICINTGQWCRFTEFYVEHRQRIIPDYKVIHALVDVKNYMRRGRGAILTDEADQVVGMGSFVLGLADQGFEHKEIAVLGNCYFTDQYQNNRTFVRGLQVLAEQIGEAGNNVKEVRIPTAADNAYTNHLYQKFSKRIHTFPTLYGQFHVYSTTYDQFVSFCRRFR